MIKKFHYISQSHTMRTLSHAICITVIALFATSSNGAVVQRGTTTSAASRPTVATRTNITSRMPTMSISPSQSTPTTETEDNEEEETVEEDAEVEEEIVIENKSSQFDEVLGSTSTSATDSSSTELAEMIQRQRAALDAQDATNTATQTMQTALASGQNACDIGLRKCMQGKCGNDFSKCSGDTDTSWGNKMDSCRRETECSGEEYRMFASEIKADRDMNASLASYNAVIDCGNRYNDCIMTQCGVTFSKCLGKAAGDAAIAACETIAKNCTQQDNGLANRTMQVFATLRQDAEKQVQKDEERLYDLRDQMAEQCRMLGAMFDERSLDCVYTVEFYAGDDSALYASKKAYAGNTFDCTPNWFGIDVTTFMENAYRLTRTQTSATSSLLGSGLGTAAGALTSGAIDRAIDTQKAESALKDAKKEYQENYGDKPASSNATQSEDNSNSSKKEGETPATANSTPEQKPAQESGSEANPTTTNPSSSAGSESKETKSVVQRK